MYNEDVKLSENYKKMTRIMVESEVQRYNDFIMANSKINSTPYKTPFQEEANMLLENDMHRTSISKRYTSFSETVRNSLVIEAVYKLFKESVSDDLKTDSTNLTIMRSMVNSYVTENGYENIMNRMKKGSTVLAEMYKAIKSSDKNILENVDKSNPDTFIVTPEMKDEFFKQLDYSDTEAISTAIKDRVSNSLQDFVTANTKDHDDITEALEKAKEKIDAAPEDDVELKESYEMQAKYAINTIRNKPKGVLHSMITSTCESILKHQDTHIEFMNEGHLDMKKIVDRTSIMYTFIEMLNTSRLEKIDEAFIQDMISDLKK